jgi:hypothetical protein
VGKRPLASTNGPSFTSLLSNGDNQTPRALFLKHTLFLSGFALLLAAAGCHRTSAGDTRTPDAPAETAPLAPSDAEPSQEGDAPPANSRTSTSPVEAISLKDRAALLKVWSEFAKDWNSKDPARLARWNPTEGVLLLDNPGAFIRVERKSGVPELLTLPGNYDGARIKSVLLSETVDEGPLQKSSCEEPDGLKKGVFLGVTDASFVTTAVKAMDEYDLAPQDQVTLLAKVEQTYAAFEKFVVHDTRADVSFVFALAGEKIVIIAVNAVIPCSA